MRYRARVEYDGTDLAGFQLQPGTRTVQGELEAALAHLCDGHRVRVAAAGRTDAGVHALGQVIAFDYGGRLSRAGLRRALDALLPKDVAVRALRRAPSDFQPRRAVRREYRYSIWNGERSPLHERTALGIRQPLDVAAMERAGAVFVGRHDFAAFGGPLGRHTMRTVHGVRVRREGATVMIDIAADAFLRQMVRAIAAALIRVGRGVATVEDVAAALERSGTRAFAGEVAPAKGLCLRRVVYRQRERDDTLRSDKMRSGGKPRSDGER